MTLIKNLLTYRDTSDSTTFYNFKKNYKLNKESPKHIIDLKSHYPNLDFPVSSNDQAVMGYDPEKSVFFAQIERSKKQYKYSQGNAKEVIIREESTDFFEAMSKLNKVLENKKNKRRRIVNVKVKRNI